MTGTRPLTLCALLVGAIGLGTAVAGDDHAGHAHAEKDESARAEIGEPAPDFSLTDQDGETVTLADLRGQTVVLEWFNPDCPFVVHQHTEGPLVDQAARVRADGVVWLAINSGAPGKQGAGHERNVAAREDFGMDYPVLFDESGEVGRMYGAKTTPHMYVIDGEGVLVYAGAIDNAPRGRADGDYRNFVDEALAALADGSEPPAPQTPYGCGVKYAD